MKKIGLIGEDPNDTQSIQNLLIQKHSQRFQFKQLIKNQKGYYLDNPKVEASLKIECEDYHPDYILFIRDADALPTELIKIGKILKWFEKLNNTVGKKGLLLMNIYELEALILADIKTFNRLYHTSINYTRNVMYQKEPKEFLKLKTFKKRKQYNESDCPNLFKELSFDVIIKNCTYFKKFYENFLSFTRLKD